MPKGIVIKEAIAASIVRRVNVAALHAPLEFVSERIECLVILALDESAVERFVEAVKQSKQPHFEGMEMPRVKWQGAGLDRELSIVASTSEDGRGHEPGIYHTEFLPFVGLGFHPRMLD